MQHYRIRFYNELPNDSGHMFRCCQQMIEIRAARSKDRAIEAAKRRFTRRESIQDWRARASIIEVEELGKTVRP